MTDLQSSKRRRRFKMGAGHYVGPELGEIAGTRELAPGVQNFNRPLMGIN